MSTTAGNRFSRLPHTSRQAVRGTIGLLVGGAVGGLTAIMIYVMTAPIWVNLILGALALVGFGAAILAPGWYWIVQPLIRGSEESDASD